MNNTVMIVDDKKLNIDMLMTILRQDYTIMAALSGEAAIRIMEKKQPDLVLLDVYMPEMDGMEVLTYMKGKHELAGIPVIFVSGEHEAFMEEKGLELGAVDYVKKPYNAVIISYKIRNILDIKNYRDHLETIVAERTRALAASREAIIMGMSMMSECHDSVTGRHIERIKIYTRILCNGLLEAYPGVLPPEMIEPIILYSPLHDVGKVAITDGVLKKKGLLTPVEFDLMKRHTLNGADLLRKTEHFLREYPDNEHLDIAIDIAECHHERFDGSGYHRSLKGEEIPLPARIVSVADVYDALRSPRPYKNSFTHGDAVNVILHGDTRTSPAHFDPRVLDVFDRVNKEFEKVFQ